MLPILFSDLFAQSQSHIYRRNGWKNFTSFPLEAQNKTSKSQEEKNEPKFMTESGTILNKDNRPENASSAFSSGAHREKPPVFSHFCRFSQQTALCQKVTFGHIIIGVISIFRGKSVINFSVPFPLNTTVILRICLWLGEYMENCGSHLPKIFHHKTMTF